MEWSKSPFSPLPVGPGSNLTASRRREGSRPASCGVEQQSTLDHYVFPSPAPQPGAAAPARTDQACRRGASRNRGLEATVAALREAERLTFETPGIDGIALRYGLFYGSEGPLESMVAAEPAVSTGETR
jgi:hypothetical protein